MTTQETVESFGASAVTEGRGIGRRARFSRETLAVGAVCLLSTAAAVGLQRYIADAERDELVPQERSALLDEQGRRQELTLRRKSLPVVDVPYAPSGDEALVPFVDDAQQRQVNTAFRDEDTGLVITARTHLCLPGVDPCISGGVVSVADDSASWQITFQLLGAGRPSAFQSNVPRSREFLERLKSRVGPPRRPTQDEYRAALQAALDAEPNSNRQQAGVRVLLDLLLSSFFTSDEYAHTVRFAEREDAFD